MTQHTHVSGCWLKLAGMRIKPRAILASAATIVALLGCSQITPSPTLRAVDPHVELTVSETTVKIGETLTVIGVPVDIGLPYYTLHLDEQRVMTVKPGEVLESQESEGGVVRVVSASATIAQVEFLLEGREAGSVEVWVSVTGEIHYGYPGPTSHGAGTSERVTIKVVNE